MFVVGPPLHFGRFFNFWNKAKLWPFSTTELPFPIATEGVKSLHPFQTVIPFGTSNNITVQLPGAWIQCTIDDISSSGLLDIKAFTTVHTYIHKYIYIKINKQAWVTSYKPHLFTTNAFFRMASRELPHSSGDYSTIVTWRVW